MLRCDPNLLRSHQTGFTNALYKFVMFLLSFCCELRDTRKMTPQCLTVACFNVHRYGGAASIAWPSFDGRPRHNKSARLLQGVEKKTGCTWLLALEDLLTRAFDANNPQSRHRLASVRGD